MPAPCIACGHEAAAPLLDLGDIPASGVFLESPDQAPATVRLAYAFCPVCGLIRRRGAPAETAYAGTDRATARRQFAYVHDLLRRTAALAPPGDGLVLDVGANDGAFLDLAARAGYRRRLGVEPSRACAAACAARGHAVVAAPLDRDTAAGIRREHGPAAIVFCRHTIEHVADPLGLLEAAAACLAPDGLLVLETPHAAWPVAGLRVHELWQEHLFVFHPANLARLLDRAGLAVVAAEAYRHDGTFDQVFWARPGLAARPDTPPAFLEACRALGGRFAAFAAGLRHRAAGWPRPVAAMGAAHVQAHFLLFTGLGAVVDHILDDDPRKRGRWLPVPRPVPVIGTAEGIARAPATLLETAFAYPDWTRQVREGLGSAAVAVDPYAGVAWDPDGAGRKP